MEACEREACRCVIEGGAGPDGGRVAQGAIGRKSGRFVGRIIRAVVVGLMAVDASCAG